MSTWGDSIGKMGRPDLGTGTRVAPDDLASLEPTPLKYERFDGGLNTSDNPEEVGPDQAIDLDSVICTLDGALQVMPGMQEQTANSRALDNLFEHSNIDGSAQLLAIDPPYICYGTGGAFTNTNVALAGAATDAWNGINVAGVFLFSNGTTVTYTRAAGAGAVTDLTAAGQIIAARSFALQFGRCFAGGVTPTAGTYQALGVSWNASSGSESDWTGAGSGSELLLGPATDADYIVALATLGFDLLVVFCRHSIWFGYPTGNANRPADFRLRTAVRGCQHARTVCVTPYGIIYASDDGIRLLTANSDDLISSDVAALQTADITLGGNQRPSSVYVSLISSATGAAPAGRYILSAFLTLYEFEFTPNKQRRGYWTKSAYSGTFINNVVPVTLNGVLYMAQSTRWGVENAALTSFFGSARTGYWVTSSASKANITDQFITVAFDIEYYAGNALTTLVLQPMNHTGTALGTAVSRVLPIGSQVPPARYRIPCLVSGMTSSIRIQLSSTSPPSAKIYRVTQFVIPGGPTIASSL